MTISTFHSDSDAIDGLVTRTTDPSGGTWSSMRSGAGTSFSLEANMTIGIIQGNSNWIYFQRVIMLFDTSDLGSNSIIDSAKLDIVAVSLGGNQLTGSISIVTSDPLSDTGMQAADYSRLGTTNQATPRTIAGLTIDSSTHNSWTLTSPGLASISKTGISKFGATITADQSDSEPTMGSLYDRSQVNIASSRETLSSDKRPRLVVTHSSAFTPKAIMF